MGNAESKQIQAGDYSPEFNSTLKDYQKREIVNDDRFGQVTVYNLIHSPKDLLIVKDKWVNTDFDSVQLTGFINSRAQDYHKGLAK